MATVTNTNTPGMRRMMRRRGIMLGDQPFFGTLSYNLMLVEDASTETLSTDGTVLRFNPEYTGKQKDRVLDAQIAHEVLHCGLGHPYRMGGRDPERWNEACDYVVNALLVQAGYPLWDGALTDPQYAGMSAEQIYAKLPAKPEGEPGGNGCAPQPGMDPAPAPGDGDPDPNGQPQPGQAPQPQPQKMTATDWQIAAEQAALAARKQGTMPGGTDRAIKDARQSREDWRNILRRFLENAVPSDYSWAAPNRRYVHSGLYLPGTLRENMPRIGVAVDTSGSVSAEMLRIFAGEITAIMMETRPEAVEVVYCDAAVTGHETFTPDGGPVTLERASGGGGTAFQPALDYFADMDDAPAAVIYLTDGYGWADNEPEFPVLWAILESSGPNIQPADFGERVTVSEHV